MKLVKVITATVHNTCNSCHVVAMYSDFRGGMFVLNLQRSSLCGVVMTLNTVRCCVLVTAVFYF